MAVYKLFITFIIYSFMGWILEVGYHIFKSGKLINRGFLFGPLCPIYGNGAVIIILLLTRWQDNSLYIFLGGFFFASVLEYITGFVLEKIFHTRWWDYSKRPFNIKGYIALDFSIIWGLVSVFMMKVIHPRVSTFVDSIPKDNVRPVALALLMVFTIDLLATIESLVEFRSITSELVALEKNYNVKDTKLAKKLEELSKKLSERHKEMLKAYPYLSTEEIMKKLKEIINKASK